MEHITKKPHLFDDNRELVNMPFEDIACSYDKKYGLENLNGVNKQELKALAKRKAQQIKAFVAEQRKIVALHVALPEDKNVRPSPLKIVYSAIEQIKERELRHQELVRQANENWSFNEQQSSFTWYGYETNQQPQLATMHVL